MQFLKKLSFPPILSIIATVIFTSLVIFIKWGIELNMDMVFFLWGAIIGLILLDVLELLFEKSSPFRTVLFELVFVVLGFFIVSSSASVLGVGVVLSYFLRMIVEQALEIQKTNQLVSWTTGVKVSDKTSFGYIVFIGGIAAFVFETAIFVF